MVNFTAGAPVALGYNVTLTPGAAASAAWSSMLRPVAARAVPGAIAVIAAGVARIRQMPRRSPR